MSRRIPLPRLTRRQRSARWQRERRQQAVIVTVFSAVLFFVLGLVSWAASDNYYQSNLKPAMKLLESFRGNEDVHVLGEAPEAMEE